MKIFYITDETLSSHSVEAVHIDEICKNLSLLGHWIRLYAPPTKEFDPSHQYEIVYTRKYIPVFLRLWRDIKTGRPDVLYARHNLLLVVPSLIGAIFGIPVVLEMNGKLLEESKRIDPSLLGKILRGTGVLWCAEHFSLSFAKKIIVVTPSIKDYIVQKHGISPDKISVVFNGVDTDLFTLAESGPIRKALGLDQDAVYAGYIGSFYIWQGLRHILEAARIVAADHPKIKFMIIGRGEELDYIHSFVEKNGLKNSVKILPSIPHAFVPRYLNALDICLCYPTTFRHGATSPFKVYEYLASEKAVIVSDIRGMREEFSDTVSYVAPESPTELAQKIIELARDEKQRRALASAGRKFVEQEHSWHVVADCVARICEGALTKA